MADALMASVSPTYLDAFGGETLVAQLSIANASTVIDAYSVRAYGLDPLWVTTDPARLSLFPGEIGTVDIRLAVPHDYPAGLRPLTLHVQSENDPSQFALTTLTIGITGQPRLRTRLEPSSITGGSRAQFNLVVVNTGNSTLDIAPSGLDPEDKARFEFQPAALQLQAGEQTVVRAVVRARRPWVGAPKVRMLGFHTGGGTPAETMGSFVQRPRIGRWLISLIGLAAAAAVFAAVLSTTLNKVVDEASVGADVVNEALKTGDDEGAAKVPLNPARIGGAVVSAIDGATGLAGVQAALYSATDGVTPLSIAATSSSGEFSFDRLGAGTYRVQFTGAGFGELWYPAGRVFAEADDVKVDLGGQVTLDSVPFGGTPGSVAGTVVADDVSGAKVSLLRTGLADPSVPALVAQVDVSADGSFVLDGVPTPAEDYTLVVERLGAATETRHIAIDPGQQLEGIRIELRSGDGVVSGEVFGRGQPLGNVTVTATDGATTITTMTLTEDYVGFFALRELATPGTYTVTVSTVGYVSQTRTVSVTDAQPVAANFTLEPDIGTISGTVSGPDLRPLGGVSVRITGINLDQRTTSISQGDGLGTFRFEELPSPGNYTLTFTKAEMREQVHLVELSPGTPLGGGVVDVTMAADSGTISGQVLVQPPLVAGAAGAASVPVALARLSLTDGADTRVLYSADEPLGRFSFAGLTSGNYTLTAQFVGAVDVVQLLTLQPGESRTDLVLELGRQASLSGRVIDSTGNGVPGLVVRLVRPEQFLTTYGDITPVTTDSAGRFTFPAVAAPTDWVVAVYQSLSSVVSQPLDSHQTASTPGIDVPVTDLVAG